MTQTLSSRVSAAPVFRDWELSGLCVREATYPPLHRMAAHADGRSRLSLVVAGAVEEFAEGVPHLSVSGSVVLKPAEAVHANRFGPNGARIVTIEPSAAWMEEFAVAPVGATGYRWRHGVPGAVRDSIAHALSSFATRRSSLRHSLAAVASFLGNRGNISGPPRWLDLARRRIHSSAHQPPSVRQLAADAHVHPVYFARAFRRYFSGTVAEYIRRVRVLNAAEWLTGSDEPLAQIALRAGFTDQAHFCHAFRRETGTTPAAYRVRHRRQVAFLQDPIASDA